MKIGIKMILIRKNNMLNIMSNYLKLIVRKSTTVTSREVEN